MDFRIFVPITKIDMAKRLIFGAIAEEVPDKSGEIMDYKTAKPEFEAWSNEISKASGGRSVGNLRAMHGQIAAGKLESLSFDDGEKRIVACGKIVDDAEWNKVLEGVYTGFSMGGKYLKRWKDTDDPRLTRYTPRPTEVSLVDNPCIPTATFEVVKEDGSTELRKFKPGATYETRGVEQGSRADHRSSLCAKVGASEHNAAVEVQSLAEEIVGPAVDALARLDAALGKSHGDRKKPYGDIEYADPGYQPDEKKRYPLDSEQHIANLIAQRRQ